MELQCSVKQWEETAQEYIPYVVYYCLQALPASQGLPSVIDTVVNKFGFGRDAVVADPSATFDHARQDRH